MLKSDLHPPESGLDSDPVLYGVAAGLADLFPPIPLTRSKHRDSDRKCERDDDPDQSGRD